jgi:hypothetical protein
MRYSCSDLAIVSGDPWRDTRHDPVAISSRAESLHPCRAPSLTCGSCDKEVDSTEIVEVWFLACLEVSVREPSGIRSSHHVASPCLSWAFSYWPPRQNLANTLRTTGRSPVVLSQPNARRIARMRSLSLRSWSSLVPRSRWIRANALLNSKPSQSAKFTPFFTLIRSALRRPSQYSQLQSARN